MEKFYTKVSYFWNNNYIQGNDGYLSVSDYAYNCRYNWEKKLVIDLLRRYNIKGSMLSIGCGNASLEFDLLRENYFTKIDCIDLSSEVIKENLKKVLPNEKKNINFICGNYLNKNYKNKYDFIFVGGVLMYCLDEDLNRFLKNIKGNLRKNGLLVMRESSYSKKRKEYFKNYPVIYRKKDEYLSIIRSNDLRTRETIFNIGKRMVVFNSFFDKKFNIRNKFLSHIFSHFFVFCHYVLTRFFHRNFLENYFYVIKQ